MVVVSFPIIPVIILLAVETIEITRESTMTSPTVTELQIMCTVYHVTSEATESQFNKNTNLVV